jgi:hypothetical protein
MVVDTVEKVTEHGIHLPRRHPDPKPKDAPAP